MHSATARFGDTTVRWLHGGLLLRYRGDAFVLDAPPAVAAAIGDELPHVRGIVLTGGRIRTVGGLVELLCALAPHRAGVAMDLQAPLGDERGPALAETWVRGWGAPFPLSIDAARPGARVELGPIAVTLVPIRAGEPDWANDEVRARVAVALRVETPDACIAWVPGAAPSAAVRRACDGADLAVVEVGVEPWPRSERPWRLSMQDALRAGEGAGDLWVVGDDGGWPGAEG